MHVFQASSGLRALLCGLGLFWTGLVQGRQGAPAGMSEYMRVQVCVSSSAMATYCTAFSPATAPSATPSARLPGR